MIFQFSKDCGIYSAENRNKKRGDWKLFTINKSPKRFKKESMFGLSSFSSSFHLSTRRTDIYKLCEFVRYLELPFNFFEIKKIKRKKLHAEFPRNVKWIAYKLKIVQKMRHFYRNDRDRNNSKYSRIFIYPPFLKIIFRSREFLNKKKAIQLSFLTLQHIEKCCLSICIYSKIWLSNKVHVWSKF